MDDRDSLEPQERRPPLYNPEDYVLGLKKFSKLTGLQLYLGEMEIGANNKAEPNQNNTGPNNNSGSRRKIGSQGREKAEAASKRPQPRAASLKVGRLRKKVGLFLTY